MLGTPRFIRLGPSVKPTRKRQSSSNPNFTQVMKLTSWEHFPNPVRKAWKVMRITTLLILVISLHLSASTSAQKITLASANISIEQFFNQLEKQTGYSFLLENGVVSKDEKISVNVKDVTLETVLDQILKPISLS